MVDLKIYNLNGSLIYNVQERLIAGTNYVTINTEDFDSGIYFYKISINGKEKFGKLIKQ